MSLSFTPKQINDMVSVLEGQYDTIEQAAKAVLQHATALVAERQNWLVIAQRKGEQMALAWFASEAPARAAARSLAVNNLTSDEFRCAVMPVFHGSPADYHRGQRKKAEEQHNSSRSAFQRELQRRLDWFAGHPGAEAPEDMRGVIPF